MRANGAVENLTIADADIEAADETVCIERWSSA